MQLFLSISGIILSAILLWFNARKNKSTIYLGIFFLLAGMYGLIQFALFYSGSVTLSANLPVISGFIPLFIGPTLYFYIRSVLKDDPALKKHDLWHLFPVLLFLIFTSPYLLTSWSHKTEIAANFIANLNSQDIFNTNFLGNKLLAYLFFIMPTGLYLTYVLWSAGLLLYFLKSEKEKQVFHRQQSTIKWIKAFLSIEILLVTGYLLFMIKIFGFGDLRGFAPISTIGNILGIGPLAILILTFFSPGILYGLPRVPQKPEERKIPEKIKDAGITPEKTTQIQLEREYLQSIGREMETCMEKFKPYINPDFSLAELSVLIHIPVHHLSYYFREEKKQSFTDFRNEWRVKHAKKLMEEGKTGEMTLEAIGLLSGFPNRDSFRAAFQRIEGITPAVFITRMQE